MSASKGRGMAEKTMASTINARRTMPKHQVHFDQFAGEHAW